MTLDAYQTLGNSGLIVSPLSLGAMTFGRDGWGAGDEEAHEIFNAYIDAGGNFIDTANVYAGGKSEEMVGRFIAERSLRERVVLATKFGFSLDHHPNAGGNGAKAVTQSLDASLRRLSTDYVDLYLQHCWDTLTPPEEVLETMTGLVRAGKVRYWGMSNVPAWYVTTIRALASAGAGIGPVVLQYEYSLVARDIEGELMPMAKHFGIALQPWSPLAGGFLTGKYSKADKEQPASSRLSGGNPIGASRFTQDNWRVLDVVRAIAGEVGVSPAQISLAWAVGRDQVRGTLIGARRVDQLMENIVALNVSLSDEQLARLDEVSLPDLDYPGSRHSAMIRQRAYGGASVSG